MYIYIYIQPHTWHMAHRIHTNCQADMFADQYRYIWKVARDSGFGGVVFSYGHFGFHTLTAFKTQLRMIAEKNDEK